MVGVTAINDDIIKSPEDTRDYRGVVLDNNMKVLLISDPTTDKSAAALNVNIGHMADPWELPGLAHFCEHMLFLGTKKFPDEAEYKRFLSQHGGAANASTGSSNTRYYFYVAPDHLHGALDRFGQFFIAPLFTESATEREVNAVNKENDKNIANDGRIIGRMEKTLVDQKHEYSKFGTGNKESLHETPLKSGINVRDELIKFHENWYSSNIMTLAVLGKEDLDTLQNIVIDIFGNVEDKNIEAQQWQNSPLTDEQFRKITYVVPVKDVRSLRLTWSIPDLRPHYKTDPAGYLTHLFRDKGPGSLYSHLKAERLVNSISSSRSRPGNGFSFFKICLNLAEEGVDKIFDIITVVFQFLEMIKKKEPEKWIFDECKELAEMNFRYKDKELPQSLVCSQSRKLLDYPIEETLIAGYEFSEWKPDLIKMIIDLLEPHNLQVIAVSQKYVDKCTQTEKWYGVKYKTEIIDEEMINTWVGCGLNEKLSLPLKNELITTDFDLIQRNQEFLNHPMIIEQTDLGRLWYRQDEEFLLPKSCITIEIKSPICYNDPHMANLNHMFVSLLEDSLKEFTHAAIIAGLHYGIYNTKNGIVVMLEGFSQKQSCLLEKILAKMKSLEIDENRFEILKDNYVRSLKNFKVEQPSIQAGYFLSALLSEKSWLQSEKLEVVNLLTVESVQAFIPQFLSSLHIECLVYGNTTETKARQLYKTVLDALTTPATISLTDDQLRCYREVKLDPGQYLHKTTNKTHKSSCLINYYQCGERDSRKNMLLQLLVQVMKQPCFYQLRTVEQLGYIVSCTVSSKSGAGIQAVLFKVQSDRHPDYLDERVEAFIEGVKDMIESMEKEEFEKHVEALAVRRLEKPKMLSMRRGKMWDEISAGLYNFDRDIVEVEELRKISKEDLLEFYQDNIAVGWNRKKLSCEVLSTMEGGPAEVKEDENGAPESTVRCMSEVKPNLGFYPLPGSYLPLQSLTKLKSEM